MARRSQPDPHRPRAPARPIRRTTRRPREDLAPHEDETLDSIGVGEVSILQKKEGYRFNLDPVLLAHFAAERGHTRGPVVDLGTGSGIIPILLAKRFGWEDLVGLEIQPGLYDIAHRNVQLNRCERAIQLALGDLKHVKEKFAAGSFGLVLANPPYGCRRSGKVSPTQERAIARHEVMATLNDYITAACYLLADRGAFKLVYPASRMAELIEQLCSQKLRPRHLRAVHPKVHWPAKRVLIEAIKGGRDTLKVLPPLILHRDESHHFSDEVAKLIG